MSPAILPELSLNIIDRYLVACETLQIEPIIVLNKIDLLDDEGMEFVQRADGYLPQYRLSRIDGFQSYSGWAETAGRGVDRAHQHFCRAVWRWQIQPAERVAGAAKEILTNDVSDNSGLGQHTTTAARLYHFPHGGDVIDSPGVREFGLWHLEPEQITQGFVRIP